MTASSFERLPDEEKDKVLRDIESKTPRERLAKSRPLTTKEKNDWKKFLRGAYTQHVSIQVEKSLLKKADKYAKEHRLNRSELFTKGVQRLIKVP